MNTNHKQLQAVFDFLMSQGIYVGDANFDQPDTIITFSSFHYKPEDLRIIYTFLHHFFNESVNMTYSEEIGLSISMGDVLLEDEPTEIIDESVSIEIEPTRKLEIPQTSYAAKNTSKPTSERFGFIL